MGNVAGDSVSDCVGGLKERRGKGSSGCQWRRWLGRARWARKGVGDGVGGARSVGGRDGELGDEGQLALLAARFRRGKAMKCRKERFVVSEEEERAALQVITEVENGGVHRQQFPVESGVTALGRR